MYDKETTFKVIKSKIVDSPNSMQKVAGTLTPAEAYDPEFLYVWVRGISAGEYWGPNKNADFFSEKELRESHHTFLEAHVFKNHDNKDVAKAIGSIIVTLWNNRMKCVELLLKIDRMLAPEIVRAFEKGYSTDVSMGCRVKETICSICGNHAKVRADFCDHVKTQRNQIMHDGKRVYEFNVGPRFHDMSVVLNGADRTAKVLEFVDENNMPERIDSDTVKTAGVSRNTRFGEELKKVASTMEFDAVLNSNDERPLITPMFKSAHEKIAEIQKEIIDKFYTLAIMRRMEDNLPGDIESEVADQVLGVNKEVTALSYDTTLEKTALISGKDIRNVTLGGLGVALATNYYQGKRMRGEPMNGVQDFVADNPGVLPMALIAGYPLAKSLKRKAKMKAHPEFAAYASSDNYETFLEKKALLDEDGNRLGFSLDSKSDLLNVFNDTAVAQMYKKAYHVDDSKFNSIKAAALLYAFDSKKSFENLVKISEISDNELNGFIKISLEAVDRELSKQASVADFGGTLLQTTMMQGNHVRGINPGFAGVGVGAALIDALLLKKFFGADKEANVGLKN